MQSEELEDCSEDLVTEPIVAKNERETVLSFHGITYRASKKLEASPILDGVSGTFRSGRLAAIIGHSGAGKSSLLNVLSGHISTGIDGTIVINNESLSQRSYRKLVAYNTQEIALLPNITVQETLEYAFDLRCSSKVSRAQKSKIVEGIISLLGLQKCSQSQARVLSGGERKRLSIGQDLVSEPNVMLFDEPTSGLDSESSYQVMSYLKDLAKQERCLVAVVHQPSSDMLELFDDIYVMSCGRCLYGGSLEGLVPHFENMGYSCPRYYNRAEFVMKITPLNSMGIAEVLQAELQKETAEIPNTVKPPSKDLKPGPQYATPAWRQITTLTRRTALGTIRNFALTVLRFGGLNLFITLTGIVYYDIGNDAAKVISNTCFLALALILIVFVNSVAVVLSFPMEAAVFVREYRSNCYSITAYFLSKLLADFVPVLVGNSCYQAIGYFMSGQPAELDQVVAFWVIMCLIGWFGQIYGLLGGCVFSLEIAPFVVPVSLLPMMLFAGFFIRFSELNAVLRPLIYLSPFKYAFEGVMLAIYGGNRSELACSDESKCFYRDGGQVLDMLDMVDASYWEDVVGLSVIIVVLHVLVFICLVWKVK